MTTSPVASPGPHSQQLLWMPIPYEIAVTTPGSSDGSLLSRPSSDHYPADHASTSQRISPSGA